MLIVFKIIVFHDYIESMREIQKGVYFYWFHLFKHRFINRIYSFNELPDICL